MLVARGQRCNSKEYNYSRYRQPLNWCLISLTSDFDSHSIIVRSIERRNWPPFKWTWLIENCEKNLMCLLKHVLPRFLYTRCKNIRVPLQAQLFMIRLDTVYFAENWKIIKNNFWLLFALTKYCSFALMHCEQYTRR